MWEIALNTLTQWKISWTEHQWFSKWDIIKLKYSVMQRTLSIVQKWQLTNWEKICTKPTSDRGLLSRIYKELKKLDSIKPNNTIWKWGTGLKHPYFGLPSYWDFLWSVSYILGTPSLVPNIHLSVNAYHVCSFVIGHTQYDIF